MQLDKGNLMKFLEDVDKNLDKHTDLIAVGGTAMTLLGLKPSTIDIDFNLSDRDAGAFRQALKAIPHGYRIDIFENGNIFSQQLPDGFEKECIPVKHFNNINLMALHPLDIIATKIGRLNERDIQDIEACIRGFGLTRNQIRKRASVVEYAGNEENYQYNLEYVLKNLFRPSAI